MELNEIIDLAVCKLAELNLDGALRYMEDDIYHKPSHAPQLCYICHDGLEKDTLIRREQSGATIRGHARYIYAHVDCFLAVVLHMILEIEREVRQ